MRILISLLAFFIFSQLYAQQEADLVKKIKTKLDLVNDYKAEGNMLLQVPFIDAPPSSVTIFYKKPDKFTIRKSGGISILPQGGVRMNLSSLLVNENYDVVPGKDVVLNGTVLQVIKLLSVEDNSDVVMTTLYIDQKKLVVVKAVVNTKENGTYEIQLNYGKYIKWGLPDKVVFLFNSKDYKLPKGITFEYEKGGKKKEGVKNNAGKVTITYSNYVINKGISDKVFNPG